MKLLNFIFFFIFLIFWCELNSTKIALSPFSVPFLNLHKKGGDKKDFIKLINAAVIASSYLYISKMKLNSSNEHKHDQPSFSKITNMGI